jgi:uncharacterized membrane protein
MQLKANDRAGMIPGIIVGISASGIILTSRWLPAMLAWHFNAAGAADAFVLRSTYLVVMVVLTVGVPLLVRFGLVALVRGRIDALPIPHRDYWLGPERRDATTAYLTRQTAWMAATAAVLFLLAHLLGLGINPSAPLQLLPAAFTGFVVAILAWLGRMAWRFRKP